MRKGEDRHQIGVEVFELLFPGDVATPRGLSVGDDAAGLGDRLAGAAQGGSPWQWTWTPEDPHGNGRRLTVDVSVRSLPAQGGTRVDAITARWVSSDRLDIDSAWAKVREHLERLHGRPDKEVGNVLKLVWRVSGGPMRLWAYRYRDMEGRNLLELVTKVG